MQKCFIIMPFNNDFDSVYETIRRSAQQMHVICTRSDERFSAGYVVRQIIDDISEADIVICDLTGNNPNVFYEVGIAHEKKPPKSVILIAQDASRVPFDLQALRFVEYQNTEDGRDVLCRTLKKFISEAKSPDLGLSYEVIDGIEERTRRIVADLNGFLRGLQPDGPSLVVRQQAGLSSLAISNREPKRLKEEKLALRTLISQGTSFKVVLNPPTQYFNGFNANRVVRRYDILLELLEHDPHGELENCTFSVAPWALTHKLIIGSQVFYEGHRAGIVDSFDLTMRIAGTTRVKPYVRIFDAFFESTRTYTMSSYAGNPPTGLRKAVINALQLARTRYTESIPHVQVDRDA